MLVILAEAALLWWAKSSAPAGMLGWVETHNDAAYYGPNAPDSPYHIGMEDSRLLADRVAEANVLSGVSDDFGRIVALRRWTREVCPGIALTQLTNDPSEILAAFDGGKGGACGALGALYCATLMAHGYRARLVQLIRDSWDVPRWRQGPPDTHVTVEVFSPDHRKWIVSDPTFGCWFRRPESNVPLSARELQLLASDPPINTWETGWISLARAGLIVPEYDGQNTEPRVETYYIDQTLLYRNVFLLCYDVYRPPVDDPVQKYTRLAAAHFLGTEKVVWLLPPGQRKSLIASMHTAINWLPFVAVLLLILLMVPGRPVPVVEEELESEDEEE